MELFSYQIQFLDSRTRCWDYWMIQLW